MLESAFTHRAELAIGIGRFFKAFTRAEWAEISVVTPEGASVARKRLDLRSLPTALIVMERLGREVAADAAEPIDRCGALHLEIH